MNLPNLNYSSDSPISKLSDETPRPLWSVMIPTYNSREYLRETLLSILAQDPGVEVMQIAVVDNHSTKDDPEPIVRELGQGRIEFFRQPANVGMMNNFNTCINLARGQLVHILHSDDTVLAGFYEKMAIPFHLHPVLGAAFCRNIFMDEYSNWQSISEVEQPQSGLLPATWLQNIVNVNPIQTPSIVVRRGVYEEIGGFDNRCEYCGDWEMWTRITAHYPMWFEVTPLAAWRVHTQSATRNNVINGSYAESLYQTVRILESYLKLRVPQHIFEKTKQNCAFFALETADMVMKKDNIIGAIAHLNAALRYCSSFRTIRSAGRILLWNGTLSLLRQFFSGFRPQAQ